MPITDKLLSYIGASKQGVDEMYRERRSDCIGVWRSKIRVLIFSTLAFSLMAGAVLVSPWGRVDSDGRQAHMTVLIVQRVSMEEMVQVHALAAAVSTWIEVS